MRKRPPRHDEEDEAGLVALAEEVEHPLGVARDEVDEPQADGLHLVDEEVRAGAVRVLRRIELAQRPDVTATALREALSLDPGYLSRILGNFEKRGLVTRTASEADGRCRGLQSDSGCGRSGIPGTSASDRRGDRRRA